MRTHCGYEQAEPDVDAVPDAACTCMRVCGAHARVLAEPQVSAAQHVRVPKLLAARGSGAGSASAVLTFTTSKGATTRLASADAVPAAAALSKTPASEAIITGPNVEPLRRLRTPPEVRAGRQAHRDADCTLVAPWQTEFLIRFRVASRVTPSYMLSGQRHSPGDGGTAARLLCSA